MKLKTFDDLAFEDKLGGWIVRTDEAKQEVIKHIKSMNEEIEKIERIPEVYYQWKQAGSPYIQNQEIIRWLKWFFDITEKDLKTKTGD